MGALWAYRSSTHLRSNPVHTCMIKVILAAFLIAHAHLIPRLLFSSFSSFAFSSAKLALITQQVLPAQTYGSPEVQNTNISRYEWKYF